MTMTKRKLLCPRCLVKVRAYEAEQKRIQRIKVAVNKPNKKR